jgi:hypothetical protein
MSKNFTFKTEKSTREYRGFYPPTNYIKHNKLIVGEIESGSPFRIRLRIVKDANHDDGNPNCPWMWITLAKDNSSVDDAKVWLELAASKILSKYNLHHMEK